MNASNVRQILYFCLANIFFATVVNELTSGLEQWIRTCAVVATVTATTIGFTIVRNRLECAKPAE